MSDKQVEFLVYTMHRDQSMVDIEAAKDFKEWLDKNKESTTTTEDLYIQAGYVINFGAIIKMNLMQLRTCFMAVDMYDDLAQDRQEMMDFFNMDYVSWLDLLKTHDVEFTNENPIKHREAVIQILRQDPSIEDSIDMRKDLIAKHANSDPGRNAQRMDMYYSNLVHGAAVRVPLAEIWCPDNELEHSDRDTDQFFRVMWRNLKQVLSNAVSSSVSVNSKGMVEYTNSLIKSIKNVRDVKRYMKEIWEESKSYRISDQVHMTEIQVLQRLKADRVFEWLDCSGSDRGKADEADGKPAPENLHMCFYMRRCVACVQSATGS
jgi:hypothetical protein